MKAWRRSYILGCGEHPWRLMAWMAGVCALIGVVIGHAIYQNDPTPIVVPPERAWQQPIIDALGSYGFVCLMGAFAGACFGLAFWLKLYVHARRAARWIRASEAAGIAVVRPAAR